MSEGWTGIIWIVCVQGNIEVRYNEFTRNFSATIKLTDGAYHRLKFWQFGDVEITLKTPTAQFLVCQEAGKKLAIAYRGTVMGLQPGDFHRFNSNIGVTEYA